MCELQRDEPVNVRRRRVAAPIALLTLVPLVLALSGCGDDDDEGSSASETTSAESGAVTQVSAGPVAAATTDGEADDAAADAERARLLERSRTYWAARRDLDWETVFSFRAPERRADTTPQEFAAWSQENEPLGVSDFTSYAAEVNDHHGWVDVETTLFMRLFDGAPKQTNRRWVKWTQIEGEWYPVPPDLVQEYPGAPAERDAAQERALREAFDRTWVARRDRDWQTLYDHTTPAFRERVSVEEFSDTFDMIAFFDHNVHWIEVRKGEPAAKVRLAYLLKANDPNMVKLEPSWKHLMERWRWVDGAWWWDVPVPPVQNEPEAPNAPGQPMIVPGGGAS